MLDQVPGRLGDAVVPVQCDVSEETDVARVMAFTIENLGRLDIVHTNAGIGSLKRIVDTDLADWRRVVDVCLTGTFLTIKHAARVMNDGGAIIATSSLNTVQPAQGMAAYCAAKAGIAMLVEVAAMELGERRIRVNAVAPGLVRTPTNAYLFQVPEIIGAYCDNTVLGRTGEPDEIASLVAFLASDEATYITGSMQLIDGGAATKRYPLLPFL